jgi:amidohydrolase
MALTCDMQEYLPDLVAVRRALHAIPETGLHEVQTQRFILDYLAALGVDARPIAQTGVKAVIPGGKPGIVTAFRADMDALNVQECTGCGFESSISGMMHACGHDGHMAMALVAVKMFLRYQAQLKGSVVFLFQPCEENVRGARLIIAEGGLKNPDVNRIFALHLMPHIDQGVIGVVSGALMAGACEFIIEITGRSAHGAMPHLGVDAIVAASQFVCAVQTVISRSKSPEESALITIGRMEGGRRHNIIADRVVLEGTVRCYESELMEHIKQRILAHLRGIEESYGVKADFRVVDEVPPTINSNALARQAVDAWPQACVPASRLMVAEDFGLYCRELPGFMGLLGCRNEALGYTESLHSSRFNFDEVALTYGLQFYKRLVLDN